MGQHLCIQFQYQVRLPCKEHCNLDINKQRDERQPIVQFSSRIHNRQYQKDLQIIFRRRLMPTFLKHHLHPPFKYLLLLIIIIMQEDYLDSYYDFDDSDTFKLRAGKSNLPQAGLGLFSTGQFEKGEYITEYYGSIVTVNSSWNEIFNDEDKMVQIDKQYCLIGRSLASRANDIINFNPKDYFSKNFEIWRIKKNLPRIFGIDYNAKLSMDSKQKVFLKATNKIRAGQEIYIEYGFDYWLFYYQFLNGKYLNQTK